MIKPLFDPQRAPELIRWVKDYCLKEFLVTPGDKVLVVVSGGPDSVALLRLLHRLQTDLRLSLGVAHFDHGLRRPDLQQEAAFVAELARSLALPYHQGAGEVRREAQNHKISLQMAARRLRLAFLQEVRHALGYDKIALRHTADDQVGLFFIRLLRGTGPEGLKGMWPASPDGLIRPLLAVGKQVILAWLHQQGFSYRQDASNLSRTYRRNQVRLDLIPHLRQHFNPKLPKAVWRLRHLAQEEERLLAADTASLFHTTAQCLTPDLIVLDLEQWRRQTPALQRRLRRHALGFFHSDHVITAAQTLALEALACGSTSGGELKFRYCHVARAGRELHFLRPLPRPAREIFNLPCPSWHQTLVMEDGQGWRWTMTRRRRPHQLPPLTPWQAWLDAHRLHPPSPAVP